MSVRSSRTVLVGALSVMALLAGVVAAFGAGSDAPPRMAFVARGDGANFADALAAGSVAGQFGAPVFTTPRDSLASATETALEEYAPEVVVILGGTGAISESVELAVLEATGLSADKVIRAQGANRYATAAEIADLVDSIGGVTYSRAWLPVNGQAADADLLDGLDSSAFLGASDQAVDSDTVDGVHADAFDLRPTKLNISPAAFIDDGDGGTALYFGSGSLGGDSSGCRPAPVTLEYTDDTVADPPAGDVTTYFLSTCVGTTTALHGVQLTLAYS